MLEDESAKSNHTDNSGGEKSIGLRVILFICILCTVNYWGEEQCGQSTSSWTETVRVFFPPLIYLLPMIFEAFDVLRSGLKMAATCHIANRNQ